jgi:hypothetical protein
VVVPVVAAPALVGGDVGRGWSCLGVVEARMARDGDGEVSRRIFGTRFILFYFLRRPSPFFKPRLLLLLDSFSL